MRVNGFLASEAFRGALVCTIIAAAVMGAPMLIVRGAHRQRDAGYEESQGLFLRSPVALHAHRLVGLTAFACLAHVSVVCASTQQRSVVAHT